MIILLLAASFPGWRVVRRGCATCSAPQTNPPETVKPLDPAAATRAWLDTVPAEKRAKSDAYFEGGYWLILWNFLLGAAISLLLLGSGFSARLRDFAERTTHFKALQVALYAIPYVVIVAVLSFPLGVYSGYFREHAYGSGHADFWALVRRTTYQPRGRDHFDRDPARSCSTPSFGGPSGRGGSGERGLGFSAWPF